MKKCIRIETRVNAANAAQCSVANTLLHFFVEIVTSIQVTVAQKSSCGVCIASGGNFPSSTSVQSKCSFVSERVTRALKWTFRVWRGCHNDE